MGVDPKTASREMEKIIGEYARFEFLKKVYTYALLRVEKSRGDDEQMRQHRAYHMRAYLLYMVGTTIFMDKSATYVDVIYVRYFEV